MQDDEFKSGFRPDAWVAMTVAERMEATAVNKFHTKTGHGFAAEDANILNDRLHFRDVENVGASNTLDGPDRLVNGVKIQTKYCQTAASTVDAAFKGGRYRYAEQRLEVPRDQYAECVSLMREKIRSGQVEGVTDPAMAESIVAQGSVTYKQARNIAKAGTVDGLVYDAKSHAVGAAGSFGIAFALDFAVRVWSGEPKKEALKESVLSGLASGAITLGVGIATSQVLRTKAAAVGRVWARDAVRLVYNTPYGKVVIRKVAELSLGKSVGGGAAINHVAKLARSNTVTTVATAVIVSVPDAYRATFSGTVSWPQVGKNVGTTLVASAGGVGCGYAGGVAGAALGTLFMPGPGTVVGGAVGSFVGMLAGSSAGNSSARSILGRFIEDDAVGMKRLVNAELNEFCYEYLLTADEQRELGVFAAKKVSATFLREMYGSSARGAMMTATFVPEIETIVSRRKRIVVSEAKSRRPWPRLSRT